MSPPGTTATLPGSLRAGNRLEIRPFRERESFRTVRYNNQSPKLPVRQGSLQQPIPTPTKPRGIGASSRNHGDSAWVLESRKQAGNPAFSRTRELPYRSLQQPIPKTAGSAASSATTNPQPDQAKGVRCSSRNHGDSV